MILVSRDSEGIYTAALEMLENSLGETDRQRRMLSIASDDLEQMRKLAPRTTLSPGYEDRVLYLLWMHDRMNAGIEFENISSDEADGLAAVVRAQHQFDIDHPRCGGCGLRLQFKGQKRCFGCRVEFK